RINAEYGMTIVAVSHHIASTMRMAAEVLVLLPDGAVMGTPAELERAVDPRVVCFLRADADEAVAEPIASESVPAHSWPAPPVHSHAKFGSADAALRRRARPDRRVHRPRAAMPRHAAGADRALRRRALQARRAIADHHLRLRNRGRRRARPPGLQHAG